MREKYKTILLSTLFTILSSDANASLLDFIDPSDMDKLDFVLNSEPIFDVADEHSLTIVSPTTSHDELIVNEIPSVHLDPTVLNVTQISNPTFNESLDENIQQVPNDFISVEVEEETSSVYDYDNINESNEVTARIESIISINPEFTETEEVPIKSDEEVPILVTESHLEETIEITPTIESIISINPEFTETEEVPIKSDEEVPILVTESHLEETIEITPTIESIISINPEFTETEEVPIKSDEEVPILVIEENSTETKDVIDELNKSVNNIVLNEDVENLNKETISFEIQSVHVDATTINVTEVDEPVLDIEYNEVNDLNKPTEIKQVNEWLDLNYLQNIGNHWYYAEWFGYFFCNQHIESFANEGAWIYHINLGWIFVSSETFNSVWFWSDKFEMWMWTSHDSYPYATFSSDDESYQWIYFDTENDLIYDFANKKYFDMN